VSPNFDILGDVEQQKIKMIDILTDNQSSSYVIAIIGCCGMGKTTLA
jgi:signal recognition particle GTPase